MISLRSINADNYIECLNLSVDIENTDFVDTVAWSLAEAWVYYKDSHPYAIYNDDEIIGYVLMNTGDEHYEIINFLIDKRFQNKGFGTQAAKLCVDYLVKEYSATKISLPIHPENKLAQKLWEGLGFKKSNAIEDGYVFMRLELA